MDDKVKITHKHAYLRPEYATKATNVVIIAFHLTLKLVLALTNQNFHFAVRNSLACLIMHVSKPSNKSMKAI